MTHQQIQAILKAAGFSLVMDYSKEGSYYSYRKGDKVVHWTAGRVSVWIKGGDVLLSGSEDLEQVKRAIEEQ